MMVNQKALEKQLHKMNNKYLNVCVNAALESVNQYNERGEKLEEFSASEKGDRYLGHHAIETKRDIESQNIILKYIKSRFPNAFFITEEKTDEPNLTKSIITSKNYHDRVDGLVFGVDPLDGTSQEIRGLYEHAISIGYMNHGSLLGGAIFAPDVKGGILIFGSRSQGVYYLEKDKGVERAELKNKIEMRNAMIDVGVDMPLERDFFHFYHEIAKEARTTNSIGSCALGLTLIAMGRVDVFIAPTQRVWDWFAGFPLVEATGGKLQFYKINERDRIIKLVDRLSLDDFDPAKKELGFIAGKPDLVGKLTEQLVDQYGKPI